MRWGAAVLSLASAACGRIGFDPSGGAAIETDGGTSDDGGNGVIVEDNCTEPGLVLYLAFDESDGAKAADSSGNGFEGTLAGFGANPWVPGRNGNALRFDGIDDQVGLGSPDGLDDIRPLTVCAWIRVEDVPSMFATVVDKSRDGFAEGWNFYLRDNDTFGLFVHTTSFVEGGSFGTNVWRHVCGTWDSTDDSVGMRLYRDGNQLIIDALRNQAAVSSDAPHEMTIGRATSGGFPFQGLIDELRIYDHELNEAAIRDIRTCSAPLPEDPS